jgi:hypothetical protein
MLRLSELLKSRPARDPAVGGRYGSWDVARCRADSDELVTDSASRQRYDQQHADYIDVVVAVTDSRNARARREA